MAHHTSIVNRRISFCQKARRLAPLKRVALLKEKMRPVFDTLTLPQDNQNEDAFFRELFQNALILFEIDSLIMNRVVMYLYPQGYEQVIRSLMDMLDNKGNVHVPCEKAFLGFDALQCALDIVTVLFEILQLPIPMDIIKRFDLTKLLEEYCFCYIPVTFYIPTSYESSFSVFSFLSIDFNKNECKRHQSK